MAALGGSAHKGCLQLKLGNGDWEVRFFVLMEASGDLLCLPSEDSTLRDAEGVINVREMTHLGSYPRQFGGRELEITSLDEQGEIQTYLLLADSAEHSHQWLESIRKMCDKFGVKISVGEGSTTDVSEGNAREEPMSSKSPDSAANKYEQEMIQCQCYFPTGAASVVMLVRGLDLVREVRDRIFMNCEEEGHLASEFTLKLGGMSVYLDAGEVSKARMCDNNFIQKCIDEKKPVVIRLVLDPVLSSENFQPVESIPTPPPHYNTTLNLKQLQKRRPSSEDFGKFSSPLLRRIYLHVRIIECWLKDGVLGDTDDMQFLNVIASIYHGGQRLGANLELSTTFVPKGMNPQWNEFLTFPILLVDLPEVASLNFSIYCGHQKDSQIISKLIGWTNYHFIDDDGTLDTTTRYLRLWKDHPYYSCGAVPENVSEDYIGVLGVSLDDSIYPFNLKQRGFWQDEGDSLFINDTDLTPSSEEEKLLAASIDIYDVFSVPADTQKLLLWRYRYGIKNNPRALSRFLQAVPWHKYVYAMEARRVLSKWEPLNPYAALQLLGPQFGDPSVRSYAVSQLELLPDEEICSFLVQLVQALQYEPRLQSSLLRLLLKKASENWSIGHHLYWHFKAISAGLEVPYFAVKLEFAMSEFRRTCNAKFLAALSRQEKLVLSLANIARAIREVKGKTERKDRLTSLLSDMETFESVSLPVDPRYEVNGLEVKKCKYMDSKKLPLWLVFKNVDTSVDEHIYIIFKTGDDLRQDILTLQMLDLMNKIWWKDGLDMKMSIYSCVATGVDSGMLQVVRNSETLSNICKASGGGVAVFKEDTLANWLMQQNHSAERYNIAVENFTRSCAAYCVATCVLGIGDRHNDNIMIKQTGEIFHIDFGHILGHFKSKFGIKRERARFVFTPDMAFLMGGTQDPRFKAYESLCGQALNKIRANAGLLLNLLSLMITSGLTEVSRPEDIRYMHDILLLKMSDEEAGKEFNKWLHESLHAKSTQFNHAIHTWIHS